MFWLLLACHDPLPPPAHSPTTAVPAAWAALGVPALDGVTEANDRALTLRSEDVGARWTQVTTSLEAAGWAPEGPPMEGARQVFQRGAAPPQRLAVARVGEDVLSIALIPSPPSAPPVAN